ncbi:uncharacterized protein C7orf50 homolog [Aedes albopictus]|uniref:WKF domain-containing protein n=1 Tax=Aedes albopictus TaxID=7160 RepID=A0ABM1XRH4_AEDAL|nr:uncharacterized protein C7orf50 homolog [Aedes albopictus]
MGKKKDKTAKVPLVEETAEAEPKVAKSKKEKRKKSSDPASSNDPAPDDAPSSTKKAKLEEPSDITAGTSIDQALLVNPALKLNKKTKRAKKREKHAKNKDELKQKARDREKEECRQYLQTWQDSRDKWKFQKIRQIYIQKHVFDEQYLDGAIWPVALEYLSGTKGSARTELTKQAESVIKELDAQVKESGEDGLLEGSKYQRARELLQYMG